VIKPHRKVMHLGGPYSGIDLVYWIRAQPVTNRNLFPAVTILQI